ncbi:hypothetical protein SUGI_0207960 [Cryptomeria japonica]|uniref:probable carboxylesterase 15 n=1 Tax=Cryptomeria japonica TaxID=3369 RepID=UPI002408B3AD|nr:probable carboxylesterase 15 [Cryptomeria japonica]GLJ13222.1 hypothetical protein SUGI_0207960 [Cryptomeria japonica]
MGIEKEIQVPTLVEDFAGALKLYDDGSIVRTDNHLIVNVPLSYNSTRDVVIEEELGIWVRLFLPPFKPTSSKLPVALFIHGGGFCFLSPAFVASHTFCEKWAASLGVMMVSVHYRLAPENRLPAAYDDSMALLQWLFSPERPSDPWLDAYSDLSNVFVIGKSSGGNIAHHLLMRAQACDFFNNIRGAILLQPFFGGEDRTQSENVCPSDVFVNVENCDTFWRLALPVEAHGNRDHPFSNPVMYFPSQLSSVINIAPMLVVLGGKDCLRDRGAEYYEAIKLSRKCKHIDLMIFEKEEHGFHVSFKEEDNDQNNHNSNNRRLMREAALFVSSNTHSPRSPI